MSWQDHCETWPSEPEVGRWQPRKPDPTDTTGEDEDVAEGEFTTEINKWEDEGGAA